MQHEVFIISPQESFFFSLAEYLIVSLSRYFLFTLDKIFNILKFTLIFSFSEQFK